MVTILIVEDEFEIRENLEELLSNEGYKVLTAKDGEEGFKTARMKKPDLILSDIRMPRMDGIQLVQKLQLNLDTALIPVIFLSAKVELNDIREGMLTGADDYITKPFRSEDVLKAIQVRLRKRKNQDNIVEVFHNTFIKNVPHELRTPLIGIIGFSDLIEADFDKISQEEMLEMVKKIKKSGKRLHRRIEKLIQYGILLSQPVITYNEVTSVIDIEMIEYLLSKIADEFNRSADLSMSFQKAKVVIDNANIEILLSELLENSIKFSLSGSPISIMGFVEEQNYIISIKDAGTGIEISSVSEIDLFKKIDQEKENLEGLGLGLAIVKRIVEISNGALQFESVKEEYSKIEIVIPLANM